MCCRQGGAEGLVGSGIRNIYGNEVMVMTVRRKKRGRNHADCLCLVTGPS